MGLTVRELLSIAISRELKDGEVVLTGAASAVPLAACLLAQARHAPGLTILGAGVYVNPRRLVPEFTAGWDCAPVAIADMSDVFAVTELGLDVMFYGGMQIDRGGSVNLHYIPTAAGPLRGPGLANSTLGHTAARTILYTERHDRRTLVEEVDYASVIGHHRGGRSRAELGLPNAGPARCSLRTCCSGRTTAACSSPRGCCARRPGMTCGRGPAGRCRPSRPSPSRRCRRRSGRCGASSIRADCSPRRTPQPPSTQPPSTPGGTDERFRVRARLRADHPHRRRA